MPHFSRLAEQATASKPGNDKKQMRPWPHTSKQKRVTALNADFHGRLNHLT